MVFLDDLFGNGGEEVLDDVAIDGAGPDFLSLDDDVLAEVVGEVPLVGVLNELVTPVEVTDSSIAVDLVIIEFSVSVPLSGVEEEEVSVVTKEACVPVPLPEVEDEEVDVVSKDACVPEPLPEVDERRVYVESVDASDVESTSLV